MAGTPGMVAAKTIYRERPALSYYASTGFSSPRPMKTAEDLDWINQPRSSAVLLSSASSVNIGRMCVRDRHVRGVGRIGEGIRRPSNDLGDAPTDRRAKRCLWPVSITTQLAPEKPVDGRAPAVRPFFG